jgi:carbon-monoxide dehydrogenase medium subunit
LGCKSAADQRIEVTVQEFEYVRAHSIEDAVGLLERDGARILSGGTDLIVQLREERREARVVVDIKSLPEVNVLRYDPEAGLELGAAVPCWRIRSDPAVSATYPGLVDAVSLIGGTQIQGRATLGGNLCNASPAADSTPALIVHQATCVVFGPAGRREIPVEDFCTGPGRNVLQRGEMLLAFRIAAPPERFGAHYLRFIPRNEMDIAVVGAGASVVLDERMERIISARVALGAGAPTPLFVQEAGAFLAGKPASPAELAEAARIAQEAARPISDMRGTEAQRRHLSGVLARRALAEAVERARNGRSAR